MSGVQSVERAFLVLRAVATGPAGVSELARRAQLPLSTVARLLGTLEAVGAVSRVGDGGGYRVGPALTDLTVAADSSGALVIVARAFLAELVDRVGETAGLSVPDGDRIVYLDHVECAEQVQIRDWTGTRLPLHVVSSGLVVLAHRTEADVDSYAALPLEVFTSRTIDDRDGLRRRLDRVRRDGFVWTAEEFSEGITSVAAPVFSPAGTVVAALHCHGPSYRFPRPGTERQTGELVRDVAQRLSRRLA